MALSASAPSAAQPHWSFAVKDAAITAGIALALGVFVAGFRTFDQGGLKFDYHILDVLIACVIIFAGRLGLNLTANAPGITIVLGSIGVVLSVVSFISHKAVPMPSAFLSVVCGGAGAMLLFRGTWALIGRSQGGAQAIVQGTSAVSESLRLAFPWLGAGLLTFAVLLPFLPFADQRVMDLAILILTYVMLGWGLNIVVGLAGLLDLGYVAFYAVGAYTYALLSTQHGLSFWVCLPLAGMMAAFFGILLGFPVLRLRGDYLAIVTLGFGEIIRIVLLNWIDFTKGPDGIGGIPGATILGHVFAETAPEGRTTFHEWMGIDFSANHRLIFLYFVILLLALITNFVTMRLRRLPVGRAWEALREDEIACQALGINPTNTKLTAFAIGAMFAGFAGSFFAAKQRFISPESFVFIESAIILAIVVLGGMGSQLGVVLASVLLIGLPEWFRELGQFRMLAFGLAMVLIMVFKPRGLIAHRDPTIRLHPANGKGGDR
jgi:branched-chain amino acid transport system permease protein